jgi:hypothetical protein
MPERGRGTDRAATHCKERLIAGDLDNDGGESGQEDASGLCEWVYRSGESPGRTT